MKIITYLLIVTLFLATPTHPAVSQTTQISNKSKSESWESVRKTKIKQLQSLINDFRIADNYHDAKLFQLSCKKLKIFQRGLPIDTPKLTLVRRASRYCSGKSVPEILSRWISDAAVRGLARCGKPTFDAQFLGAYTLDRRGITGPSKVLEFKYTNTFNEKLALISIETLYSPYGDSRWTGISESNSNFGSGENITFEPGESKTIRWQIDQYRFDDYIEKGATPSISRALTQLLHSKYGGGLYCSGVIAESIR